MTADSPPPSYPTGSVNTWWSSRPNTIGAGLAGRRPRVFRLQRSRRVRRLPQGAKASPTSPSHGTSLPTIGGVNREQQLRFVDKLVGRGTAGQLLAALENQRDSLSSLVHQVSSNGKLRLTRRDWTAGQKTCDCLIAGGLSIRKTPDCHRQVDLQISPTGPDRDRLA